MLLRILTLTIALSCLLVFDVVRAATSKQSPTANSSISNLQVYGDYFYWLDQADKGIYRARTPKTGNNTPQSETALGEREKLWSGLPLASPVGLSIDSSGVVYVLDGQLKAVFSLASSVPKLLYSSLTMVKPTAIAAAGDRLFVIDAGTSKLYSVDPVTTQLRLEYEFKGDTPDRLLGDGDNLVAYRFRTNVLLHISLGKVATAEEQEGERPQVIKLISGRKFTLTKVLSSVTDLSLKNDIVYFIDSKAGKLALFPLDEAVPSFIPLELVANNPFALVTSANSHFFFEGDPISIRRIPSLQPIALNFVGEWTSGDIVELYTDLNKKQLLPSRTVSIESAKTLQDLVVEQNLLPTGYVNEFQLLFCELNQSVCTPEQTRLPAPGGATPEGFELKLDPGQTVKIPDVPVRAYVRPRNVRLPLDPANYNPRIFGHLSKSSLERVARQLAPKAMSDESLRETLITYNTDYTGENIFGEVKGAFSVPVQAASVRAVVPRTDVLNPGSLVRRLVEKTTISGTTPTFQLRKQAFSSQPVAAFTLPAPAQSPGDCLPNDPAMRSPAMDIIKYCEPQFTEVPDVGIIDDKFNPRHPAFLVPGGGSALEVYKQPVDSIPFEQDTTRTKYSDSDDHGTHIAAIIGARPQPGAMVGLLPTARLFGVPPSSALEALSQWDFLRVFNVSLGEAGVTGGPLTGVNDLEELFTTQRLKLFVLAAGNDNQLISRHALAAQGKWDNVIVVGATDVPEINSNHERPSRKVLTLPDGKGSNFHPFYVGLMAPGEKIKGALFNGQYGFADGTSEAAPFVTSGAAALMALDRRWAAWQVKARLVATADLWTGTPLSDTVLAGEFNFKRALSDRDAVVLQRELDKKPCRGDISVDPLRHQMVIKQGLAEERRVEWSQVLRIKRDRPEGTEYTIIYYKLNTEPESPDRDNRQLLRLVRVKTNHVRENGTFIFIPEDPSTCPGGVVSVFDLLDFVNKGPFPPGSN